MNPRFLSSIMIRFVLAVLTLTTVYISIPACILFALLSSCSGAIFLAFLASSVANLRGLFVPLNYLIFLVACLFMLGHLRNNLYIQKKLIPFVVLGALLQIYGVVLSLSRLKGDLHITIEIVATACFSILFIITGGVVASYAWRHKREVRESLWVILFFIMFVLVLQQIFGPLSLIPETSQEIYSVRKQLVDDSGFGFIRAFGPFLGPNAFGLFLVFFLIMELSLSRRLSLANQLGVIGLTVVTWSKTAVVTASSFFISSVFFKRSFFYKLLSSILVTILALLGFRYFDAVGEAFRLNLNIEELGSRTLIYQHMLYDFPFADYLTGIGPYTWREYFNSTLGIDVQDPHSFLFSIPGSYGVAGVAFYIYLGWTLFHCVVTSFDSRTRVMAIGLIILTFIRDAAAIPIPLGTTHFTFFYWFSMGMLFCHQNEKNT